MYRNPESHGPVGSPEVPPPDAEQLLGVPKGYHLEEGDYAEDAPDNGEVYPLIQRRLLHLWKTGVPAIGSMYGRHTEDDQIEWRYGIFVKEIASKQAVGIMAGKAIVGATVKVPPLPPIHHQ